MSFNIANEFEKTFDLNGNFSIDEKFYPIEMELNMNNFDINEVKQKNNEYMNG